VEEHFPFHRFAEIIIRPGAPPGQRNPHHGILMENLDNVMAGDRGFFAIYTIIGLIFVKHDLRKITWP